jgi:hypothetical protein
LSIFRDRAIACPRCGAAARRRVALSVNLPRVPEVRAAILDGKFQEFACAACGERHFVDGPFMAIDMAAQRWIMAWPAAWEPSWRALEATPEETFREAVVENAPPLIRATAEGYVVRSVFGLAALAEKLRCLEAGIDDRALEALKLDLMRSVAEVGFHAGARLRLARVDEREVVFANARLELAAPRARLDEIGRDAGWAQAMASLSSGPYVDTGRLLVAGDAPRPPLADAAGSIA